MKLLKKKGHEGTIRKVANDEKTKCYGLIGTVGDFLEEDLLLYCDYNYVDWCFIDTKGNGFFGKTKEDVLKFIK